MLGAAKEFAEDRVAKDEITDEQRNAFLREQVEVLLQTLDPDKIAPDDLWIYGDMLRSTRRFGDAAEVLKRAAANAKGWDRRVNDTLRYAACLAEQGKVTEAIAAARAILNAPDNETAPILPATLYELVPAAQAKGQDAALADLLEEAIARHERTQVDRAAPEGKAFLAARIWHLRRARDKVAQLRAGGMMRA